MVALLLGGAFLKILGIDTVALVVGYRWYLLAVAALVTVGILGLQILAALRRLAEAAERIAEDDSPR